MPSVPNASRPAPPSTPPVGRLASYDSIPTGGFTPGTVIGERYRIIGLLGSGGMGEVYRADDLKLGQPVAPNFCRSRLRKTLYSESAFSPRFALPGRYPIPTCAVFTMSRSSKDNTAFRWSTLTAKIWVHF